ncbi:MAG TPA: FeoB small GTPase domain-containing protein [Fimbriimonas sp.]
MTVDQTQKACGGCTSCAPGRLERYGLATAGADYVVALAGNPNTGKSTIFNALTGLRQHVGNWPGKTVVRAEGGFSFDGRRYRLIDLPGTYSLLSNSSDEEVARDFLLFGQPDVTAIVVDASSLERNLNLVLQVLEITDRAVVALNLIDEAERNGITVDDRALARDLGVPVVPMAARKSKGIKDFLQTLAGVASGEVVCRPKRVERFDAEVERAVNDLVRALHENYPGLPNARWVALRLLEGDPSVVHEVQNGTLGEAAHGHRPDAEVALA